jgi:hypothetical protein
MKKILKTKTVKYYAYQCDHCDFESEREELVAKHNAEVHIAPQKRTFDGKTLLKFDSKESASEWLKAMYTSERVHRVDWTTPGWYGFSFWRQRCPMNCCDDDCVGLKFITDSDTETYMEAQMKEIREIMEGLVEHDGYQDFLDNSNCFNTTKLAEDAWNDYCDDNEEEDVENIPEEVFDLAVEIGNALTKEHGINE